MRILTANEIRQVEQKCFDSYSTEAELMLKAGTKCFEAMTTKYDMAGKSVSVLCGNGKNAGDGFVIARLLYSIGANAKIVLCGDKPTIPEPLQYFNDAVSSGVEFAQYSKATLDVDYVVDTMFGIGFHGEARAPFDTIFYDLSKSTATIISVDTPSGTNATTGEVCESCVKADYTIAISTLKMCHIMPPANAFCGDVDVVDIGIPNDCYEEAYPQTIELDYVKSLFPKLDKNSNKGSNGHQLNICSSYKMFGAGVIATKSALRTGAGLVKLDVPDVAYPLVAAHLTQPIFNPLKSNANGMLSADSIDDIKVDLEWADSVVIGCGMGVCDDTKKITEFVLKNANSPIILDADGINSIKSSISIFKDVKVPVVLTPHPGEMSRLVSKPIAEIQQNRIEIAKSFANDNNVIVVLKGANTVVTDGDRVFVNTTGNPAMAMGGTGDMLSGIIGALVAQGINSFDSAIAGVYIHGLCGDKAVEQLSHRGIIVDDMMDQLGALMSLFE